MIKPKKSFFPRFFPSAESATREATTERRRQRGGRAERKSVTDAKHDGDAKPFYNDVDDAKSVTELGRENVTKSDDEKHHEGGDQLGQKTGRIETGNRQK